MNATLAEAPDATTERLREIILDLELSRAREAAQRRESEALVLGLNALVGSEDTTTAFEALLEVFQDMVEFDAAFVLDAGPDAPADLTGASLFVEISTHAGFFGFEISADGPARRCLDGRTVVLTDAQELPEWAALEPEAAALSRSVIMAPLLARQRRAILVGVKAEPGFFGKRHQSLLARMVPLARHALIAVEQRERLYDSLKRIGALIDGAPYGVLTVERDLRIGPKLSRSLADVFNRDMWDVRGEPAEETLAQAFQMEGEAAKMLGETLAVCVGEDQLNWELNHQHLPREITLERPRRRVLDLIWTPLLDAVGDTVDSVLLSIRDVTREREMAAEIEARDRNHARIMAALDILLKVPKGRLAPFFMEADERIAQIEAALQGVTPLPPMVLVELHTLKGGARLLGAREMSAALHDLETEVKVLASEEGRGPVSEDPTASAAWTRAMEQYQALREVFQNVLTGEDASAASTTLSGLAEPFFADARAALGALGVSARVTVDDGVGPLSREAASALATALQHCVANMVDHSIAPARRRDGRGHATLTLEALCTTCAPCVVELTLRDDGAGFDRAKIALRASEKGLPQDPEDPLAVLFEPGFSTTDSTTERSGRGVGMTAVREALRSIGGEVRLSDAPGGGSQIVFTIPNTLLAKEICGSAPRG